jgi:hypothetical protein
MTILVSRRGDESLLALPQLAMAALSHPTNPHTHSPPITPHCKAHGGGRRCQHEGCSKGAATGGTPHCIAHGGGRRCEREGCSKSVARAPGSLYCTSCLRGTQLQPDGAEVRNPMDTTWPTCASSRTSSSWWRDHRGP